MLRPSALINWAALSVLTSTGALAQTTVGELLDLGGKKLSKEEVVTALSGVELSGPTKKGGIFHIDYRADGSYSGNDRASASDARRKV